tara:strand:- start:813 stop:1199 length:387 start_codon:yes stop_codon:yes gene_type:complete
MYTIINFSKLSLTLILLFSLSSCATVTNQKEIEISAAFDEDVQGTCNFKNKRFENDVTVPGSFKVRRSDDSLKYDCTIDDGRKATGEVQSLVENSKFIPSLLIDFGISDMITDKHRYYPEELTIKIND